MLKVFAVFDVKAAVFGTPVFLPTRGIALREFAEVVAMPDSKIGKYPADYAFYELGEYEPSSGKLTALDQPMHIASASQIVDQLKGARVVREVVAEEVKA